MRLPESKLLKYLIGCFAGGAVFRPIVAAFRQERTVSDAVGNFFTDLFPPYLVGSFYSQVPLVWIGSVACGAAYAIGVSTPGAGAAKLARLSLFAILTLSLFTIWIEPLMSLSGAAVNMAMQLAKVPMKIFDVGVSVLWVVVYFRASAAVGRECRRSGKQRGRESVPADGKRHAHPTRSSEANNAPSVTEGTLVISRKFQFIGAAWKVSVIVDGVAKGSLWSRGSMTLQLPAGSHLVKVRIWWVQARIGVTVMPGQHQYLQVSWNFLGSRLVLKSSPGQRAEAVP